MMRPNGLRVSRRLKGIASIDRGHILLLLTVKMAPIQPVGSTRLFGRIAASGSTRPAFIWPDWNLASR
jgi:hypothetical protein